MSPRLRWSLLVAAVVLVAVAAFALVRFGPWRGASRLAPGALADSTVVGMRTVTLWFAGADGDSLVAESRVMPDCEGLHERVASVVQALDEGPREGGVALLPPGTSALHVWMDGQGTLTLDLSPAFQQGFRGGTGAEALAVGSLVRTVADAAPTMQHLRLLCGGAPMPALAGHLPLDRPLDPHDWH